MQQCQPVQGLYLLGERRNTYGPGQVSFGLIPEATFCLQQNAFTPESETLCCIKYRKSDVGN